MMRLLLNSVIGLATLCYPFAVYFGIHYVEPWQIAALLIIVLLLKALTSRMAVPLLIAGLLYGGFAVWHNNIISLRYYPVLVNSVMLSVFAWSLFFPPSVIERLARIQQPDLPAKGVIYTRRVTQVWCAFFVINGSIALITAAWASFELWSLYNGLIAYLLIALLFAVEYLIRIRTQRMTDYFIPLSQCLSHIKQRHTPIAYHAGHYYTGEQFYASVALWSQRFQIQSEQNYALYTESAYPFAVLLFALFHAQKTVWLASNNRPETARQLQQHCQLIGDWSVETFAYDLDTEITEDILLSPLNADDTQLIIFTSGSTGEAKPVIKQLTQLETEIATLEQQWGQQVGDVVLSTVSHQHIYGLLFQVLWPLASGRCFHSQRYLNPENLLHHAQNMKACWIASPAQLKRLTADTPWSDMANLSVIFSSGGELPEFAAQQLLANAQQAVIEIYGSSETGGIAWRQQSQAWTLFTDMKLTPQGDKWQLHSPYLLDSVLLDDQLELQTDERFILRGRLDRIVKIEEKRLSLTELEQCLRATPWVADTFTLSLTTKRDLIAAALVLTETGQQLLAAQGRNALLQALRTQLHQRFESVLLPRKWLTVNTLPLTSTGKINQFLLMQLFNADTSKLPYTHSVHSNGNQLELLLKVPAGLRYFPNHFANHPILAGVVQIAWVEHFARLFFDINDSFPIMEVIKFVKLIHPNDELKLTLHWQADSKKLQFTFSKAEQICSSGRLIADIRT